MGGVILVSEGVGCNFWPREGCKNEVPAMGTPLLPPLCPCVDPMPVGFPTSTWRKQSVKYFRTVALFSDQKPTFP